MGTFKGNSRLQKEVVCWCVIVDFQTSASWDDVFLVCYPRTIHFFLYTSKRLTIVYTELKPGSVLPWEWESRWSKVQMLLCFPVVRTKPAGCWRPSSTLQRAGSGDRMWPGATGLQPSQNSDPWDRIRFFITASPVLLIKSYTLNYKAGQ